MAVVTLKSQSITNRDASPAVASPASMARGRLMAGHGFAAVTNGDSIASKYLLCSVPSNARVSQILLSCGAITSAAANIGAYYPTNYPQNPSLAGTAISAAFFAAAQSVASALSKSDVTNQSGTNTMALQDQPLWQALGLASDPEAYFDIGAALTIAATATANIALDVIYAE